MMIANSSHALLGMKGPCKVDAVHSTEQAFAARSTGYSVAVFCYCIFRNLAKGAFVPWSLVTCTIFDRSDQVARTTWCPIKNYFFLIIFISFLSFYFLYIFETFIF